MDLRGAETKLRRANAHALELYEGVRGYLQGDGMRLIPYEDSEVLKCGWVLVTRESPPDDLAAIAADMMNNLRSALNYCVWQAYLGGGGLPDEKGSARVQFPVVTDADDWDRVAGDMLRKVTGPALEIVRAAQPFVRSGVDADLLVYLAALSNEDKHRQPQVCAVASVAAEMVVPALPDGLFPALCVSTARLGIQAGVAQPVCWAELHSQPGQVAPRRPDVQVEFPRRPEVELGLIGEGRQVPISRLPQLVVEVERIVDQFRAR